MGRRKIRFPSYSKTPAKTPATVDPGFERRQPSTSPLTWAVDVILGRTKAETSTEIVGAKAVPHFNGARKYYPGCHRTYLYRYDTQLLPGLAAVSTFCVICCCVHLDPPSKYTDVTHPIPTPTMPAGQCSVSWILPVTTFCILPQPFGFPPRAVEPPP